MKGRHGLHVMRAQRPSNWTPKRQTHSSPAKLWLVMLSSPARRLLRMREQSEKHAAMPWHVSVAVKDVDETGKRFDLVADTATRAAVARIAGLRDLPRLEANFEVTRYGAEGLRVTGRVSATVGQACVVTLEPLVNEIAEDVDLIFVPRPAAAVAEREDGETEAPQKSWDSAEPLVEG